MLDRHPNMQWMRPHDPQDVLASAIRVGLIACGPAGAIVAEFLTKFVPNQRLDRLQEFTELFAERLAGLEEQFREKLAESAGFAALSEQATIAAVQTPSSQRRRDLVELLRTGMTRAEAELVEHQSLLQMLEALNDPQLFILVGHGCFRRSLRDEEYKQFVTEHAEVFPVHAPSLPQ